MGQNKNILPQGWKTKPINQVFEFIGTSSFSRNDINYEIDDNSIYYIHYGDIHATYKNAVLDFETETRIPVLKKHIKPSANFLKEGDLIIADASEDYEGVGEALEVFNIKDKKAIAGLHTFALRDKNNDTAHGYRAYLFKNPEVKKSLKTIATGSKVYGISKGNLEKFKIILPPLPEQQKIAKILFTWDKAIKLQQQLIDNKKQYKKAVMKKLLTGEVRFKGFSEVWKVYKISSLGEISSGGTPDTNIDTFWNGDINWCTPTEITALKNGKYLYNTKRKITEEGLKKSSATVLPINSLIICSRATIGDMAINKAPMSTNQGFKNIIPHIDVVEVDFLYYLLSINKNELLKRAIGSTFLEISKKDIGSIKLKMPQNTDEQLIIANYLNNIDKEIDILNNELVSFQKQKQGLMQQLLTGKIRVKN